MTKSKQPKKITIAEAFKLWMGGTGRTKLAPQTGLTKGELHQAFVKLSGRPWQELRALGGTHKKAGRKSKAA